MKRIKIELPETYEFKLPVLISDVNHGNHLSNDNSCSS